MNLRSFDKSISAVDEDEDENMTISDFDSDCDSSDSGLYFLTLNLFAIYGLFFALEVYLDIRLRCCVRVILLHSKVETEELFQILLFFIFEKAL